MKKILITGATGLLGSVLMQDKKLQEKYSVVGYGSSMDIRDYEKIWDVFEKEKPDIVLHLAAYTDVLMAERDKAACYQLNVKGTRNIVEACDVFKAKLVYMSTEYVFDGEKGNYKENDIENPVNFYGITKYMGEQEVHPLPGSVTIRTLFKPRPFKHVHVPTDMWTSGGYVDEIASEIVKALLWIDKLPKIIHIGFNRQNLFEMAQLTRNDLFPIKLKELTVKLPRDASLDCSLWKQIKYDSSSEANH